MSPVANISRVLVGVDFDEASASALKMAGVLASTWDADLTVLHSATPGAPAYFTADQIEALEAEREQSRAVTAARCRVLAEQHVRRAVHVVVEEGPPEDALLRLAADFDLIVVGTHRRHGARRWWLGSVAEAVVRRSPRPVLVVPADAGVPEARRPVTILAAGSDVGAGIAWVDVLSSTFAGTVVRSPDIHQCAPDRLQDTDLIVLSMPADSGTHFGAIVQVLKECVHPVLFVPSAEETVERSTS
jgi:nucleotide-binding universal stress UspA family protein